jgi:hypothetical protein
MDAPETKNSRRYEGSALLFFNKPVAVASVVHPPNAVN